MPGRSSCANANGEPRVVRPAFHSPVAACGLLPDVGSAESGPSSLDICRHLAGWAPVREIIASISPVETASSGLDRRVAHAEPDQPEYAPLSL